MAVNSNCQFLSVYFFVILLSFFPAIFGSKISIFVFFTTTFVIKVTYNWVLYKIFHYKPSSFFLFFLLPFLPVLLPFWAVILSFCFFSSVAFVCNVTLNDIKIKKIKKGGVGNDGSAGKNGTVNL